MSRLPRDFFERDTITVAKELLGKILVHEVSGRRLCGKIVETEAYCGITDKAAHSYGGKLTPRVKPMYGMAGTSYIYFIYGMYNCFNIVTQAEGIPEAVLIRALEPLTEFDFISQNRFKENYNKLKASKIKALSNGPGKLCIAFSLDRSLNNYDMCKYHSCFYIESPVKNNSPEIVSAKRIGIDYAEEFKDKPWRFYIKDNNFVSYK